MSIIKKIIPILLIIFITWCNQLSAEEIKKIGKYKDWQAMVVTSDSGKICFAQSLPVLQGPKSNNKRDAKLFVSFWPYDKSKNEISVTAGYEFNSNSVTAQSGKNKFRFDIKEQGFAWIADTKVEAKMIKKMKKGSRIMITGYNQKGSQTIDHYSLLGFTKAYNTVKKACS
ncbi:invasion associated locus B family protein [Candidatus Pelagibacter sp.]|nr:invasion associated locus B family protein [Candidatus Pelagibacter sp.]